MNFPLLIGLLGSFAVVIGGSAALYQRIDQPAEWDRTRVLREQYQMFFAGAYLYMDALKSQGSTASGSATWADIVGNATVKASGQIAPGMSASGMPANWTLRYQYDSTAKTHNWWTCTEMTEKAISAVAALVPSDLASRYTPNSSAGKVSTVTFPAAAGSSAPSTMTCP